MESNPEVLVANENRYRVVGALFGFGYRQIFEPLRHNLLLSKNNVLFCRIITIFKLEQIM